MRRPFILTLTLGLMGAALGCHHTAGVCDCDRGFNGYGQAPVMYQAPLVPAPLPPPAPTSATQGEQLKEMPKPIAGEKEK
jgi:hypothetical protein